jgi:4-alpha-glucanotransferase
MTFPRSGGILLHPTSLPGRYGIGDLGEWAYRFVDFLHDAGQSIWQMLPLGPTSYGDSPYQSLSTFAGNPLLISLDVLAGEGWLTGDDLANVPNFPWDHVDYGWVIPWKFEILGKAHSRFTEQASAEQKAEYEAWCSANAYWLDDFALFAALKDQHGGRPWVEWPEGLAMHRADSLREAMQTYATAIDEQRFRQWVFFRQWDALREYAHSKNVRVVGDIPIFVAHDSSDVWANTELFYLDEKGYPTVIAGVPPDYFSETGQRWGNPLYRWDIMQVQNYRWWVERVTATLKRVDIVRIDHFRGFEAYWEVPATEETAINGRWVPAPGFSFFSTLRDALGNNIPIIAEDLGIITPGVERLRDEFGLPGMKVLQFAWGGSFGESRFLPHYHTPNSIVYSGTHDNNTTVGWWNSGEATVDMKTFMGEYIGHYITEPHWEMIRLAFASVCHTAVVPLQDVLGLGEEGRMNLPGRPGGNWTWRFVPEQFDRLDRGRLRHIARMYSRLPEQQLVSKVADVVPEQRAVETPASSGADTKVGDAMPTPNANGGANTPDPTPTETPGLGSAVTSG